MMYIFYVLRCLVIFYSHSNWTQASMEIHILPSFSLCDFVMSHGASNEILPWQTIRWGISWEMSSFSSIQFLILSLETLLLNSMMSIFLFMFWCLILCECTGKFKVNVLYLQSNSSCFHFSGQPKFEEGKTFLYVYCYIHV